MNKIGIIGHGPDRFSDCDKIKRGIENTLDLLNAQYSNNVVFNIKADIGIGLWAGEACLRKEYKYNLYLPFSLEKSGEFWYEDQKNLLESLYGSANAITICNQSQTQAVDPVFQLIEHSNFIVCWWIGNKSGPIPDAINYSLSNNIMVLHALENLRMITGQDLIKR